MPRSRSVVKPACERRAQMIDRARHAKRLGLAQHLVVPRRFVVRVQQDVRVRLDQPGHERCARQFDHRRTGDRHVRSGANRLDAAAADQHCPARVQRIAVEHARRPQDVRVRGCRRSCRVVLRAQDHDRRQRHCQGKQRPSSLGHRILQKCSVTACASTATTVIRQAVGQLAPRPLPQSGKRPLEQHVERGRVAGTHARQQLSRGVQIRGDAAADLLGWHAAAMISVKARGRAGNWTRPR